MSKGSKKAILMSPKVPAMEEHDPTQFTTGNGYVLKLHGVAPMLLDQVRASVTIPEPPTYTVKVAGGDEQTFEHDEASSAETPEDKAAWDLYQSAVQSALTQQRTRIMRAVFIKGVVVDFDAIGDRWIREHESLGIHVPEDDIEKQFFFLTTEALSSTDDITNLVIRVMELTGVSAEAVASAEAAFRDQGKRN